MQRRSPRLSLAFAALALMTAAEAVPATAPPSGPFNIPPPPGYDGSSGRYVQTDHDRSEDDRYALEAERWAAANCVAQRRDDATAGAVIGGLIGAIAGSGLAGRRDQVPASILGAGAGAAAGSAIAKNTSPECPPGYLLRSNPEPFHAPAFVPGVVYIAPAWYDPWIWYGGHWLYRPYPYHRFWFDHRWHRP